MENSTVEKIATIVARSIIIFSLFFCYHITKVHYRDHYYRYIAETCRVSVSADKCVITRPNGHMYTYDSELLKEQETFHIFTFCDNGTPENFEDDFVVMK